MEHSRRWWLHIGPPPTQLTNTNIKSVEQGNQLMMMTMILLPAGSHQEWQNCPSHWSLGLQLVKKSFQPIFKKFWSEFPILFIFWQVCIEWPSQRRLLYQQFLILTSIQQVKISLRLTMAFTSTPHTTSGIASHTPLSLKLQARYIVDCFDKIVFKFSQDGPKLLWKEIHE